MLPLAIALAPSIFQGIQGYSQLQKADQLKQSNYVPPSVDSALTMARGATMKPTMPGYGRTIQRLDFNTSNTFDRARKVAGDASQLQSAVQQTDVNQKEVTKDLGAANEQYQFNNRQDLMKWLGIRGGYEQNNRDAYNAAKAAYKGAGQQNLFNAVSGAATSGIMALGSKDAADFAKKIAPGGGGGEALPGTIAPESNLIGKTGADLASSLSGITGKLSIDEINYLKSLGIDYKGGGSATAGAATSTNAWMKTFFPN